MQVLEGSPLFPEASGEGAEQQALPTEEAKDDAEKPSESADDY